MSEGTHDYIPHITIRITDAEKSGNPALREKAGFNVVTVSRSGGKHSAEEIHTALAVLPERLRRPSAGAPDIEIVPGDATDKAVISFLVPKSTKPENIKQAITFLLLMHHKDGQPDPIISQDYAFDVLGFDPVNFCILALAATSNDIERKCLAALPRRGAVLG